VAASTTKYKTNKTSVIDWGF